MYPGNIEDTLSEIVRELKEIKLLLEESKKDKKPKYDDPVYPIETDGLKTDEITVKRKRRIL